MMTLTNVKTMGSAAKDEAELKAATRTVTSHKTMVEAMISSWQKALAKMMVA